MRTKPSLMINACPYCDHDHDPSNQCRQKPDRLTEQPKAYRRAIKRITDESGKLVAVQNIEEEINYDDAR